MKSTVIALSIAATIAACTAERRGSAIGSGAPACVPLNRVVATRAAGLGVVDVEVVGGRVYRNRLATVCPGLDQLGRFGVVAITGAENGRLCRGDRVRIFDPAEARATGIGSFPECVLGDFAQAPGR